MRYHVVSYLKGGERGANYPYVAMLPEGRNDWDTKVGLMFVYQKHHGFLMCGNDRVRADNPEVWSEFAMAMYNLTKRIREENGTL